MSLNKIMIDIMDDIITKVEKEEKIFLSGLTCHKTPFEISLEETLIKKKDIEMVNADFNKRKRKRDTDELQQMKKLKHALSGIVPDDQHHLWYNKSPFPHLMQTWWKKGASDFINIYEDGATSVCVCTRSVVC